MSKRGTWSGKHFNNYQIFASLASSVASRNENVVEETAQHSNVWR
jgi:hypothetical protein